MTPSDLLKLARSLQPCFEPTPGAMALLHAVAQEAERREGEALVRRINASIALEAMSQTVGGSKEAIRALGRVLEDVNQRSKETP